MPASHSGVVRLMSREERGCPAWWVRSREPRTSPPTRRCSGVSRRCCSCRPSRERPRAAAGARGRGRGPPHRRGPRPSQASRTSTVTRSPWPAPRSSSRPRGGGRGLRRDLPPGQPPTSSCWARRSPAPPGSPGCSRGGGTGSSLFTILHESAGTFFTVRRDPDATSEGDRTWHGLLRRVTRGYRYGASARCRRAPARPVPAPAGGSDDGDRPGGPWTPC